MSKKRYRRLGAAVNTVARLSPRLAGRVAARLFIQPRRFAPKPAEAAYLAEAERLHVGFDPPLVGYRWSPGVDESPRRRVLLIHGWESYAARWSPLARRLVRQGAEVIAFDGPAAGRSGGRITPFNLYVRAAAAVERDHGPFDAFVGHSLGGGVAAQLAARLEETRRPERAVVMACFDESEHVFDRYHAMLGLNSRVRRAFDARIGRVVERLTSDTIRDYSNTAALARIGEDVAGLVVHSRDDGVAPVREAEALHAAWPGARLVVYEEEGHGLYGEQVVDEVAEFVLGAAPVPAHGRAEASRAADNCRRTHPKRV